MPSAQTKPLLEIALSLSRGMFGVLEALRDRCPHLARPPDGKLCRDLPLMFHIQLLSQSANAVGPGRQQVQFLRRPSPRRPSPRRPSPRHPSLHPPPSSLTLGPLAPPLARVAW